jgi:hypothetical protein
MKLREHTPIPKQNVLLYGDSKSGKTTGACSAPGPVLLINADLPHAPWYARTKYAVDEVEWEGFKTLQEIEAAATGEKFPYETVVLDPIGEVYLKLLDEFSNNAITPTLPTYGAVQTHLYRWCKAIAEAPNVNLIITAHELELENGDELLIRPFTGTSKAKFGNRLCALVDVYGYVAMTETQVDGESVKQPMAQLVNGKGRVGGDRTDSLGSTRELDLGEWYKTMATAMVATNGGAKPQKETKS